MTFLIAAQALIEKGMLDGMAAGINRAWYKMEIAIQDGSIVWVLIALAFVVMVTGWRRDRPTI